MAKEEIKKMEEKPLKQAKTASVDYMVEVESQDGDKYHDNGVKFEVGHKNAQLLEARGWAKITAKGKAKLEELKAAGFIAVILLLLMVNFSYAQTSVLADLKSPYTVTSDTVTNTGTAYLTSGRIAGPGMVTIQVNVTKISGTVGGTISLLGSLDGTNFKALNTQETQTALATITAADASGAYHWRLSASPFLYYRVSWTGTGTMAASFTSKIMKH